MKQRSSQIFHLAIAIMTICASCKGKHHLSIKDIRFPDPERQAIMANHITCSFGIDTGCWNKEPIDISLDSLMTVIRLDSGYVIGSDFIYYDSLGNIIYRNTRPCDFFCQVHYANRYFAYDSLGLLTYSYGGRYLDSIHYVFIPDSLKLVAHHRKCSKNGDDRLYSGEVFLFDTSGRLRLSFVIVNNKSQDTTYYSYDEKGRISTIKKALCDYPTQEKYCETKQYFYSGNTLDSMKKSDAGSITTYYYDSTGLLKRSVKIENYQSDRPGWLNSRRTRLYFHSTK